MKNKVPLLLIFLTVFIDLLGFGILIPLLPTFASSVLKVDETAIGFAIAIYSLTQFFFNPIFGNLSDKYGRKYIIVFTLLLNALGYIIFAFTDSYIALIISRIVAGIGGSSIGVAQAYIADVTAVEDRSKGMSLIGAAFGLGFVFGPLMGGYLSEYGYQVTGLASAGFSLLAFICTFFFLPESLKEKITVHKRSLFNVRSFGLLFKNKATGSAVLMFFVLTFSVANMYGTFALLGHIVYKLSNMEIGILYAVIGLTSVVVQGGISFYGKKYSDKTLIIFGSIAMAIGLAAIPYGTTFNYLAITVIILTIGTGSLQPVLLGLISKTTSEAEQGITLGLNQSFSAFGRVLGPLWGGFSFEVLGYSIPFITGAIFSIFIFVFSISYLAANLRHAPIKE